MATTPSDADAAQMVEEVRIRLIYTSCTIAVLALYFYEYLITLSEEIRLIWRRKFTGVTVLFLLNRYFPLLGFVASVVSTIRWKHQTDESCKMPIDIDTASMVVTFIVVTIFSALRVYVVCARRWGPTAIVFCVGLVSPALVITMDSTSRAIVLTPPEHGCGTTNNLPSSASKGLSFVACLALILDDMLVLIFTWLRTYEIRKLANKNNVKTSLLTLVQRDGTMYFLIMLVLHTVHLSNARNSWLFSPTVPFINAVNPIVISRLILSLRHIFLSEPGQGSAELSGTTHLTTIRFSMVGNMGAPVVYDDFDRRSDETEDQCELPLFHAEPYMVGLDGDVVDSNDITHSS